MSALRLAGELCRLQERRASVEALDTGVRAARQDRVGVAAEIAFLSYVIYFGRRAVRAGETGDLADAPDVVPTR